MKLTPNRRMANYLQKIDHQADAQPMNHWLEKIYTELTVIEPGVWPRQLSLNQELYIWEKIIAASEIGESLFKTNNTAYLAREAWALSKEWRLPPMTAIQHTEDSSTYAKWADSFNEWCLHEGWVDSASLPDILIKPIVEKKITIPKELTLVGFEELTPQMRFFLANLEENGTKIHHTSLLSSKGQAKRLPCTTSEAEIEHAAQMAKAWLTQAAYTSENTIGIVIPDLDKQRAKVIRILDAALSPNSFNVAAPIALIQYPMISIALLVLNFLSPGSRVPLEKFSQYLRSPFFREGDSGLLARSALDVEIRQWGEAEFTLATLCRKIKAHPLETLSTTWLCAFQTFVEAAPTVMGKHSAAHWCKKFKQSLERLGWPGERALNSTEQEINKQWYRLLADYQELGSVLPMHTYSEALYYLTRLARETTFLPASEECPVQVLGLLEAVGLPFQYLFVTGLHREAWPLDPAPNPFIPLAQQRQHGLPRSTPARELAMAQKFTERLCAGGKEIIFSYPIELDGHSCTISALLEKLPELPALEISHWIPNSSISRSPDFQSAGEEKSIKLANTDHIPGGTRAIKLQALCPFRAFVEVRLGAASLPMPRSLDLNAAERGEIIHQVLHLFWEGLDNQAQLLALSETDLNNRLTTAINTVFQRWQQKRPSILTPTYLALERERTFNLIFRLITLDKTRPDFEIVAREAEKIIELEGLKFKIRIDRIDRVADQEVIIDYKTGETFLGSWFGDRPTEPQLPLYGVTREAKAQGIAYAIVRPDAVKFQGVAAEESLLPGVKTPEKMRSYGAEIDWDSQCKTWEQSIRSLAKDFSEGVATVDPVAGTNTCRTCSLKPVCRIHSSEQV